MIDFVIGIVASGIRMSTPSLFAALGENIAERSGVLNLGVEGMMLIGAFAGFIGTFVTGNVIIGILVALAGPMVMAALMAFLSVSLRTNQLVAGLAIWLLGVGLAALLYRLIFGVVTVAPAVPTIPLLEIPFLSSIPVLGPIIFHHDAMIYLAFVIFGRWRPFWIVLGALVYGMVNATALGLQSLGTTIPFQFLLMLPYLLPIAILAAMYKKSVAPAALATPYKRGER